MSVSVGLVANTSEVQLYSLRGGQLPAQIHSIYPQRRPYDTLPAQEVKTPLCPRHPALLLASRPGRSSTSRSGPSHLPLPSVQVIYQPLRDIPRPRPQVAMQHVQPLQRCAPSL